MALSCITTIFLKFLILKLFQGHGATLYSDTIHLGQSSSFLHLHLSRYAFFWKVGCFYRHWLCSWKRLHILCLDYLFLFDWACLCSQKGFSKQTSLKKYFILMLLFYWLCVRVDHTVKTPKKRVGGWIFSKEKDTEMSNGKTKGGKEKKREKGKKKVGWSGVGWGGVGWWSFVKSLSRETKFKKMKDKQKGKKMGWGGRNLSKEEKKKKGQNEKEEKKGGLNGGGPEWKGCLWEDL